ncbi:acetyltransferase [Rhodococcus sp. X156]|uniref:acetyltransferase n=1 Tax=Rhodococcus sp. X156 TaxID=2499145 RepID=UPI000FDC7909|nr:acetyltransferase [Rhodococcus sp. X156]
MNATPLVIIGAGGFGREVHDVMEAMNDAPAVDGRPRFDFLGFIDDGPVDLSLLDGRGPHLGGMAALEGLPDGTQYVIGIGTGSVRRKIDERAAEAGYEAAVLVHPTATLGRHRNRVGPGTVICAHASVTTNVVLGRHTHLNLSVTVGHDAVLGDYVTVNPGATISGNVVLEDEVNIGTGAAVIQGRTVGKGAVIGASASVVKDIPAGVTAVGVPAKPRG